MLKYMCYKEAAASVSGKIEEFLPVTVDTALGY